MIGWISTFINPCKHLLQLRSVSVALRHELRSIALAADVCLLTRLPDLLLLIFAQLHVQRAQVLLEPIYFGGTRNGENIFACIVSAVAISNLGSELISPWAINHASVN